jgi:phenylacetate-CoA ligase
VLKSIPEIVPHYQVIVNREGTLDEVEVKVEVSEDIFRQITHEAWTEDILEAHHHMRNLRSHIQQKIKGTIGLNMKITLMPPGAIPRSEGGKLKRVVDQRKL